MTTSPALAPSPRAPSPRTAALFVLFASAAFAASSPIARYARPAHPLIVALGRLVVAALVLIAVDRRALLKVALGLSPRQRWLVFSAGGLLALHFACFLWGLDNTSLPAAVSLISVEPVAVVLCAWAIVGVRPSRIERVGVGLATLGAVVVATDAGHGDHRIVGDLGIVAAVVLYGLYLTVARVLKDALPAISYAALVYTTAAVLLGLALTMVPAIFAAPAWPLHSRALMVIVALGLIPTVLGHTAVQTASRTLSPSVVALASPGETVGGIAIGAIALHELPSWTEVVGAAVILAGSAFVLAAPSPSAVRRASSPRRNPAS